MGPYSKHDILEQHPELAEDVLDVYSSEIFIYLDLFLFALFLAFFLYPNMNSHWPAFIIPSVFFTVFSLLFRLMCRSR